MIVKNYIPLTYIIKKVWASFLSVLLFSTLIFYVSKYIELPVIPVSIPAFLGTSISLVLAFKMNQAYDRWWEARKIWGEIVNDSRTLIIQLLSFSNNDMITKPLAKRQIAWCYALSGSLRNTNVNTTIEKFIDADELKTFNKYNNLPLALLNKHSEDIRDLHNQHEINDYQQIQLDDTLLRLNAAMGKAERIKNTVFPTSYKLYLHLFIFLFIGMLSISLVGIDGIWEILLSFLISIPFLILEKASNLLQDPFENKPTDTAMTSISKTIEINIKQLIGDNDIPEVEENNKFYIL